MIISCIKDECVRSDITHQFVYSAFKGSTLAFQLALCCYCFSFWSQDRPYLDKKLER